MLPLLNINSASVIGWLESAAAQQWIVGILLVLLFISFIKEWMPVEITALTGTAVLMLTGILSTRDVLSSFANSGPLTVVCMFILSASLERTGLIGDLSKLFNKVAKGRELTALLVITLGAFMVSPFVNNTPVVVILMPIVLAFCRDHNIAASKLLIPLSYATILGGTCSVVGTSTNVVVLGQVQKLGYDGIQMFTVTPMGLIYAAAGLLYLWTLGRKWLPSRPTLSTMLPGGIQRDFLLQVRIPADSPHIGKPNCWAPKSWKCAAGGSPCRKSCSTSTWKKETAFFSCATPEKSTRCGKPKAWTWAGMTAAGWKRWNSAMCKSWKA